MHTKNAFHYCAPTTPRVGAPTGTLQVRARHSTVRAIQLFCVRFCVANNTTRVKPRSRFLLEIVSRERPVFFFNVVDIVNAEIRKRTRRARFPNPQLPKVLGTTRYHRSDQWRIFFGWGGGCPPCLDTSTLKKKKS